MPTQEPTTPQSRPTPPQSLLPTLILLAFLVLAFFPGVFHHLLRAPIVILNLPISLLPSYNTAKAPAVVNYPQQQQQPESQSTMSWTQKTFALPQKSRGSYLVTDDVVKALPELKTYKVGLLNLFVQHTSCALSLNENWDSDVREDMSDALDRIAPEDRKGDLYRHSAEGLDDMPVSQAFRRASPVLFRGTRPSLWSCVGTND